MTIRTDRPKGFEKWNRALRGAFEKGMRAAHEPYPLCPYADYRKGGPSRSHGQLTWSRGFIRAWEDGLLFENDSFDPR